jgi:mycothiol synthase
MIAQMPERLIAVNDVPQIAGLRFRLFSGEDDFAKMVAVIHSAKEVDQIERVDSVEDLRRIYSHLTHSDPYRDVLVAEVNEEMVAYSRCMWYMVEASQERIYSSFGFLKPAWRRLGIGSSMLHWNQAHMRQIAAGQRQEGMCFFESFARDSETGAIALLQKDGYEAVRYFNLMVRPDLENIPQLALPDGLEVRPAQKSQYRQIWAASMEAFRDHWGFDPDAEPFEAWIDERNQQPELWQVAWAGDEVAGMVLPYIDELENQEYKRLRGWTENISVRRPWRNRGLAKALIARSLNLLKEKGMMEACLGVDAQNLSGAFKLYEGMGYRIIKRSVNYRKLMESMAW